MPDFSALLDASTPLFEARAQNRRQTSPVRGQGYARKKVSISLAQGLIMNTENPKSNGAESPLKQSLDGTREEEEQIHGGSLFHAYALKVGRGTGDFVQLMLNRRLTELRRVITPTPRPTF